METNISLIASSPCSEINTASKPETVYIQMLDVLHVSLRPQRSTQFIGDDSNQNKIASFPLEMGEQDMATSRSGSRLGLITKRLHHPRCQVQEPLRTSREIISNLFFSRIAFACCKLPMGFRRSPIVKIINLVDHSLCRRSDRKLPIGQPNLISATFDALKIMYGQRHYVVQIPLPILLSKIVLIN